MDKQHIKDINFNIVNVRLILLPKELSHYYNICLPFLNAFMEKRRLRIAKGDWGYFSKKFELKSHGDCKKSNHNFFPHIFKMNSSKEFFMDIKTSSLSYSIPSVSFQGFINNFISHFLLFFPF